MDNTENLFTNLAIGDVGSIMSDAYLAYSMSVICGRAIADSKDGLKPVQRRILYAAYKEGITHNKPFSKVAGGVGEVLKNFHPHGDTAVCDALVRMAQDWIMRYPLIIPQGNFGGVEEPTGSHAAARYIEFKLSELGEELLEGIEENGVDMVPNYSGSCLEPTSLPSKYPLLLMCGASGVAVAFTQQIPPHNFTELSDAICALIDKPSLSFTELEKIVKGPDFPTGGVIVEKQGISDYIRTGKGSVKTRGVSHVEELKNGRLNIVITQIPYNVNRATLVEKIAELIINKQLEGVKEVSNQSDENTRVVLELKKGADPHAIIEKLYKSTPLESTFSVVLLALDNNRPKQMNLREMLECFIEHRRKVVTRRTNFKLKKAEDRCHILEGFRITLKNLNDIVKIIRGSKNKDEAKVSLENKYKFTERQVLAVLNLALYQLTGLELDKIEEEWKEISETVNNLRSIIKDEKKLLEIIKTELKEGAKKYDDGRRTKII
jgi:DNA gyrase subunit A